jgi:hypothetical protein
MGEGKCTYPHCGNEPEEGFYTCYEHLLRYGDVPPICSTEYLKSEEDYY